MRFEVQELGSEEKKGGAPVWARSMPGGRSNEREKEKRRR